ncbi:hypothetical protein ACFV3R_20975 [Streptomyces sp. NPDC059740]|uniref:hypothetical protein n=1 Tax=Streptomyces sp. NPDC059740 TaxID=3346926 RepID=UPI00365A4C20
MTRSVPESVPVRCPTCRRENSYSPPPFSCSCGSPLALPVLRGAVAEEVRHRTWQASWVEVCCEVCGRVDEWPAPEVDCTCGTVVRLTVVPVPTRPAANERPAGAGALTSAPPVLRPAFRPVTIRTARDCVTAAGQYLKWLGFTDLVRTEGAVTGGPDLRGRSVVAQVDPSTRPTPLRDVECLWLNGLNESALAVHFSLAGYAPEARSRADSLRLPLFVMDLTGTPQPVNDAADDLVERGAA